MTLKDLLNSLTNFIGGSVVAALSGAVVVVFFVGLINYMSARATGSAANDEKKYMIMGLFALILVFSLAGILAAIIGLFK